MYQAIDEQLHKLNFAINIRLLVAFASRYRAWPTNRFPGPTARRSARRGVAYLAGGWALRARERLNADVAEEVAPRKLVAIIVQGFLCSIAPTRIKHSRRGMKTHPIDEMPTAKNACIRRRIVCTPRDPEVGST